MRFLEKCKDGGPKSRVWAYVLCEFKPLFSVMLLRFDHGSREAFHNHAFNAISWVIKGKLEEHLLKGDVNIYEPSAKPIFTARDNTHQVFSIGRTWTLTFRGPWKSRWKEIDETGRDITLTHGRVEL